MAKLCTFAFTLVSAAAVSSASAAGPGNLDGYTFDDFKLAYDKSYGSEAEEATRKLVFDAALAEARAHNAKYSKGE